MSLLSAIARMEGFGVQGSRARRNNNPGNIEWGSFAAQHGATGREPDLAHSKGRFAVFPSADIGFVALKQLLLEHYATLTVEAAILKYAPPSENDSESYIRNICNWAQCKPTDIIKDVLQSEGV